MQSSSINNLDLWDYNYQRVFYWIRQEKTIEQCTDKQLVAWYNLWNRAYKNKRMKKPEYLEKWNNLNRINQFIQNAKTIEENYFKNNILPNTDSKDSKERNLAIWMKEQDDPEKCVNTIRWDSLKSTYSQLFE